MASAPSVTASLLPKTAAARIPTVRSSVGAVPPPPPPPPRFATRRNYLRRKLLKTLIKPSPETLTLTQTPPDERQIEPEARDSESPASSLPAFYALEESEASSSNAQGSDFVEASVSEASPLPFGLGRVSAPTALRFGAYFVAIYLLQAAIRALVVDSDGSTDDKPRRRRSYSEQMEVSSPFSGDKLEMNNGELLYVNETQMEAKIAEIRMMALEAKERERKNSGEGGLRSDDEEEDSDDEVEDDSPRPKSGIEREIDGRLTRVKRRLDTARENPQVMNVNFLNKPKQEDAEKEKKNLLGKREEDEMLMFEKKYKFKNGDTSKPRDKPRGFQGSDRIGKNGSVHGKGNGFSNKASRADMESSGDLKREDLNISDENSAKQTTEASIHFQAPKKDLEDDSIGIDSKKGIEENVEQQKGEKTKISRKDVVPRSNGGSKGRRDRSTPSTSRGDIKKTDDSSDMRWLKLPYVLAIAMQQGYEDLKERGFYSLKTKYDDPSQSQESHTVLFEDRGDAQNFCLLLESYFEELEEISISVVPLPIKELNDAVRSQTKKVIVVRKGQLRLYAGQPLDEVETALRSLLK